MCCRSFSQKEQHHFELFYSDFHLTNVAVKSFAAVYTYTIEKFVVGLMFLCFFSPRLHLFDQQYSNIVKYYYNLK